MIAVDTNVLVGAIQTFDLQLHRTARHAVKCLYRQREPVPLPLPATLETDGCRRRRWDRYQRMDRAPRCARRADVVHAGEAVD